MKVVFVVGRNSDKNFGTFFAPSAQRFGVECFQIGDTPDKDGNLYYLGQRTQATGSFGTTE